MILLIIINWIIYSFDKNKRFKESPNRNPGVGSYDLHLKTFKSSPAYKLGTSSKGFKITDENPGPGQYNWKRVGINSPKYSFIGKHGVNKPNLNPGPGTYDIQSKNKGGITMKMKYYYKEKDGTPGPQYEYDLNKVKVHYPAYS